MNSIKVKKISGIDADDILSPKVLELLLTLHNQFNDRRLDLLNKRVTRQQEIDDGKSLDFLSETRSVREGNWKISSIPKDLEDRRVEITGPVFPRIIINALNSPAKTFMADFEDSFCPTWDRLIEGQIALREAVNRTIKFSLPNSSKVYELGESLATLIVRPRGWHLEEKHVTVDGVRVSASLFDFVVYLVNNFEQLHNNGSGPYFYLAKLENHLEARLWNDIFMMSQKELGMEQGTIKATVLIETITAAFEMDEILFELREHSSGLNCGRWDYIFSLIKKFRTFPNYLLPDRDQVTMNRHFMKSYADQLIQTCHKRDAHAMGGMAAQIPIKSDPEKNDLAMSKVQSDKLREANAGHDGTWIAHPGLSSIALDSFNSVMGSNSNQINNKRNDVQITAKDLLKIPSGSITEDGLRENIRVGVQYIEAWLSGNGCVPLYDLMEDAATAEISRSQIWQWITHRASLADTGQIIDEEFFVSILDEEMNKIAQQKTDLNYGHSNLDNAIHLFKTMSINEEFDEFLTLSAYEYI